MAQSPDDYRRASGGRFNTSAGPAQLIGQNAGHALIERTGPVTAWQSMDFDSPVLQEFMRGGAVTGAGIHVSEMVALRNSTYFRAENLISSSIGMLPTFLMRKKVVNGVETIEKATDHPLYRVLKKRPNTFQTAFEFKTYMQQLALRDGNAYGLIIPDYRGRTGQIIPLARGSVTPKLSPDWRLTFEYRRPGGGTVTLKQEQVFHFRHPMTKDGLTGLGLRDIARETIGISAQAEKAASRLLTKGTMAKGALEHPGSLEGDAYDNLERSLREDFSGADADRDWMILEEGMKANAFGTNAKDAEFDLLRKRQAEEVSRFTDVPRPLLMFDETSWGTGIEQLGLFFVTYCLMKWFVAWEQAIERSCLTEAEQNADELYVKFNEGALLRGSLKDQAEFFKAALGPNQAYRSVNEVRGAFDMNPKTGDEVGPDAIPQPVAAPPAPTPKEPS